MDKKIYIPEIVKQDKKTLEKFGIQLKQINNKKIIIETNNITSNSNNTTTNYHDTKGLFSFIFQLLKLPFTLLNKLYLKLFNENFKTKVINLYKENKRKKKELRHYKKISKLYEDDFF